MARIRTIKPEFFRHEELFEAEKATKLPLRVAYAGLWTAADREGRFRWKPRQLKLDCLPFDDVDFSRVLDALATRGFIVKYGVDGEEYGFIPSWGTHQVINNREAVSTFPEPKESLYISTTSTRAPRVPHASPTPLEHAQGEGKGREGNGKEGEGDSAEPQGDSAQIVPPVITIPLIDKTEFHVDQKMIDEWQATYQAVDVMQQLREMRQWCIANPARRKTSRGALAFITRWLGAKQDRSGGGAIYQPVNKQEALEQRNRLVADAWLAKQGDIHEAL